MKRKVTKEVGKGINVGEDKYDQNISYRYENITIKLI